MEKLKAAKLYLELIENNWLDQSENPADDIDFLENLIAEYGYSMAKAIAQ